MIYDDDEQFFIQVALHLVVRDMSYFVTLCLSLHRMDKVNLEGVHITHFQEILQRQIYD